jgi:hypothetical protein
MNIEDYARFLYYACRSASIEYGGEPLGINRTLQWEHVPVAEQTFYRMVAASFLNYTMIGLSDQLFKLINAVTKMKPV